MYLEIRSAVTSLCAAGQNFQMIKPERNAVEVPAVAAVLVPRGTRIATPRHFSLLWQRRAQVETLEDRP